MKNIAGAMQSMLATSYGTEPVCIIEVQWLDLGQWHLYANKDIVEQNVSGVILSISTLESIIKLDNQGQTQQINITLSDTAGILKNLIDNYNIHGRPCRVYQWFENLPLSERFLLFEGEIVSDIQWLEGDRTLAFEAITKSQDREVGFSPEEGDFYAVPENLVGVAWPLAFGFVQNVPAVRIQNFPSTGTREVLGKVDPTILNQLTTAQAERELVTGRRDHYKQLLGQLTNLTRYLNPVPTDLASRLSKAETDFSHYQGRLDWLIETETNLEAAKVQQEAYEQALIAIGDSSRYPQNTSLQLNINGVLYTGVFDGDNFIVDGAELSEFDGDNLSNFGFTFLEGGTVIKLGSESGSVYVANILESTINYIKANKTIGGVSVLTKIPESYYTTQTVDMGPYTVTLIKFEVPLEEIKDAGWDSKIYVTLESIIGPNTVDIIEWLITTYTDLTFDSTTFDYVKTKVENYPSNFALLNRPNIMSLLEDIVFQARCAIWIIKDVFYLKYLPEEVVEVDTITESDIDLGTIEISTSPSEDIVTKLIAEWKESCDQEKNHQLILRHNIDLYGVKERTIEFFIYNIPSLVTKAATFWIIRFANVWKNIQFTTCLHKLPLETFDTVKFDFNTNYIADVDIKGLLTQVSYDVEEVKLTLKAWLPVLFGSMEQYNFAWPATIDSTLVFVTNVGGAPGQLVNDDNIDKPEFSRVTWSTEKPSDIDDLKPRVRFAFEAGEPPETEERETVIEKTDVYPGQVLSFIYGTMYSVAVYEHGRHLAPTTEEVKQLEQDGPRVLDGTWTLIAKHTMEVKIQILYEKLQGEAIRVREANTAARDAYFQYAEVETDALRVYERAIIDYETATSDIRHSAKEKMKVAEANYNTAVINTERAKAYWDVVDEYANEVYAALAAAHARSLKQLWDVASTTPSNQYTIATTYTMQASTVEKTMFPGKVLSGTGAEYQVELYEGGLDTAFPTEETVKQLQIAEGESIRPGTWTFIHRELIPDTTSDTGYRDEYTMQAVNIDGEAFPGIILDGGTGGIYNVNIYPQGLDGPLTNVDAKQLQISDGTLIPTGTWALVARRLTEVPDSEPTAYEYEYVMQVPVWL